MKKVLILFPLLLIANLTFAFNIVITVSESDAEIFVNGTKVGTSPQTLKINNKVCIDVEVKKLGYVTEKRMYCNSKKGFPEPPKKEFIIIKKDESKEDLNNASSSTEIANIDIDVHSSKTEEKAWKLLSEVITTYFDILEVSDKSTGYIRTSWATQSFKNFTVRTRVIIKTSSSDNSLKYKVKIISEISDKPNISAKDDEKFKPWDRILKKYNDLVPELQTRLK